MLSLDVVLGIALLVLICVTEWLYWVDLLICNFSFWKVVSIHHGISKDSFFFLFRTRVKQHAALIGGPNTTCCSLCHKLFLGNEALMEHMKHVHKDVVAAAGTSSMTGKFQTTSFLSFSVDILLQMNSSGWRVVWNRNTIWCDRIRFNRYSRLEKGNNFSKADNKRECDWFHLLVGRSVWLAWLPVVGHGWKAIGWICIIELRLALGRPHFVSFILSLRLFRGLSFSHHESDTEKEKRQKMSTERRCTRARAIRRCLWNLDETSLFVSFLLLFPSSNYLKRRCTRKMAMR